MPQIATYDDLRRFEAEMSAVESKPASHGHTVSVWTIKAVTRTPMQMPIASAARTAHTSHCGTVKRMPIH